MAAMTTPGAETFDAPREHRSFRLSAVLITTIEDLAHGIEAGESGLKSCAIGALSGASMGASAAEVNAAHHREVNVIEDEDECFNQIGDLLAEGFSHEEVAKMVTLGGGATHMLALERWCDRVRLRCRPDDAVPSWSASASREKQRRAHRTMTALRATPAGVTHAAVLHIVYGWPDPFVRSLPPEIVVELGPEFARLARYTDAVEAHRIGMAHAVAARVHASAPARPVPAPGEGWLGEAVSADARLGEDIRMAVAGGYAAAERSNVLDLVRHRDRLRWADSVISSGDALRDAVASPRGRRDDESKEQYREHVYVPARDARETFLTAVKLDANRMLTDASLAFRDAWQAS